MMTAAPTITGDLLARLSGIRNPTPEQREEFDRDAWEREQIGEEPAVAPVLTSLSDVEPQPINWLWPQRIACGKLTLLFGDPGLGKSFLTIDMAARVTTGSTWPDGTDSGPPGNVILITAEDDLADTVRPRLDRARADVRRVHALEAVRHPGRDGRAVERSFTLDDLSHLDYAIGRIGDTKLVVVDPVSAYLGGRDGHRNDEIRGLLSPLAKLASDRGVAVVMVTHLSKGGGGRALYRAMGSLAFIAAARSAWVVVKDKDDPKRRLFLPAKNNIGNDETGLAYSLVDGAVSWERGVVFVQADEAMADGGDTTTLGRPPEQRNTAEEWLRSLLAPGPLSVAKIQDEAKAAGIAWRTLQRAKEAICARSVREQFGGAWSWSWSWKLIEEPTKDARIETGYAGPF